MTVRDTQVGELISEYEKHGIVKHASMMAGMDRKTGRKYLRAGKLPSEMKKPERDYRTRKEPFEADWEELRGMLKAASSLEAKALFGWLQERNPDQYHQGQLRTFQRKVLRWRAMEGPDKRVYFGQCHIPGEAFQVDFTNCNELEITIEGDAFDHLLLRGSRDFESVAAYEKWVEGVMTKNNDLRRDKIKEALKHMRPLTAQRLAEYRDETVHVCRESTIRVMQNSYSGPSRLIGEKVKVRIFEERLEVYCGGRQQLCVKRLLGQNGYRIDYRHIIWSMVQHPGAFPGYRYRQELFPGMIFRRTYDLLCARLGAGYKTDLEYLRILHRRHRSTRRVLSVRWKC